MPNDLITPEEIKTLRAGAKTITVDIARKAIAEGKVVLVKPITLKSGYMVSMTFDKLDGRNAEHISVSNEVGKPDPADAEIIAREVIGGYTERSVGVFNSNVIHFIKIVEDNKS